MTVMTAIGRCIGCGVPFSFNPELVPSSREITGKREPVCRSCMDIVNRYRAEQGLPPFAILPGAYEPEEVA